MTVTRPEPEPVPDEPDTEGRDEWLANLRDMLAGRPRPRRRMVVVNPKVHRFIQQTDPAEFSPVADTPQVLTRSDQAAGGRRLRKATAAAPAVVDPTPPPST